MKRLKYTHQAKRDYKNDVDVMDSFIRCLRHSHNPANSDLLFFGRYSRMIVMCPYCASDYFNGTTCPCRNRFAKSEIKSAYDSYTYRLNQELVRLISGTPKVLKNVSLTDFSPIYWGEAAPQTTTSNDITHTIMVNGYTFPIVTQD